MGNIPLHVILIADDDICRIFLLHIRPKDPEEEEVEVGVISQIDRNWTTVACSHSPQVHDWFEYTPSF